MPSSHIMKPMADIVSDYIDALVIGSSTELPWPTSMRKMGEATDTALQELKASYGLSDAGIYTILCLAVVSAMGQVHQEKCREPNAAPAADFI